MTRLLTCAAAVAVLAGCSLGTNTERSDAAVVVGIGDQMASTFTSPLFQDLGVRHTRNFPSWNVALKKREAGWLDAWVQAALAAKTQPLISFSQALGSRCPKRPCVLPSVRQYTRAFRAFRKRWPMIRTISPWNEANHRSQPTFKNPKRAAQYYNVVRKYCRGCKIVAADVIDEKNMVKWLTEFKRHARSPRIWGLHNYRDTNPRRGQRFGGTKELLRTVRGPVWITETGGIVKFVLPDNRTLFPRSTSRAAKALRRTFTLAKRFRSRVKRLYIYNWTGSPPRARFDAGLVNPDGSPRPGYRVLKRMLVSSSAFRR
jgi:hypothetical protein